MAFIVYLILLISLLSSHSRVYACNCAKANLPTQNNQETNSQNNNAPNFLCQMPPQKNIIVNQPVQKNNIDTKNNSCCGDCKSTYSNSTCNGK